MLKCVIFGVMLFLALSPSISSAAVYGINNYSCGLYGIGCIVPVPVIPSPGTHSTPDFYFDITPLSIFRVLLPGAEYEENVTVTNVTTYNSVIAEFVCTKDNSCKWAKFIIDGIPSSSHNYIIPVNKNLSRDVDFVVDIPIEARDLLYQFNITISSMDGEVIRSSNYVMEAGFFSWFLSFLGSGILGNISGFHVVLVSIGIVAVLLVYGIYRKYWGWVPGDEQEEEEYDEEPEEEET
jgi:hypothetical protein